MRIAILNKYQDKVFRGAETFVHELSKRLSKKYEVDVISKNIYLRLLQKKYDVIVPTNGRFQAIFVRKIAWLSKAKVVTSGQSGMGWDDRINLYIFPDAFVALSSKALAWAKKVNPFVKSVYIPNGVDLSKFKNNKSKKQKENITVLCVGAATKQKRLDLVIKAVAKLEKVNLLIASGGGNLTSEIKKLGNKTLGERFEMVSVPFDKMPEIYSRADVLTLPSSPSEAFGNVLVEAMASGTPVVARDDLVRREIVGDAGLFTDPENTNEYAKTLKKALETDWKDKPRKQAEKFSWDSIAESYSELLKEIT